MALAVETSTEPLRRCGWCGVFKPVSAFAFRSKARGTRQYHCRSCHAAYRRAHYLRNRDDYIAREVDRIRKRRNRNRTLLRSYLRSHPCIDCGETDILTLQFDHRDRATKRTEVALLIVRKPWSVVVAEIAKCDVRCANCHRRRTASQLGWHRADSLSLDDAPRVPLETQSSSRRCTGCGVTRPIEEFAFRDRKRGRRRNRCRYCMRAYAREHYRNNKTLGRTAGQKQRCSRQDLNREINDYLVEHPCVDCGERDPLILEFDHRDSLYKLETVAFLRARGQRDELFAEIAKCDVRCSNCHQRRTAQQFGWSRMLAG